MAASLGASQLRAEFCTGGCEDRTWAREAEETPLLKAFARECLIKTERAVKYLAYAVVIFKVWRLAIAP
jgi:hypothetical protein